MTAARAAMIAPTVGLASKNAILIVEFARNLAAEGKSLADAAVEAARLRLRPILMTALAFGFGVLPLALSSGAGAASRNAVGTAVVGGMLAATILAILFVPLFFVLVERGAAWMRRLGTKTPSGSSAEDEPAGASGNGTAAPEASRQAN